MAPSTRWLLGTIAVVIAIAVAATVVATVRQPADLPPGTPGAVVQRYLRAVADGDDGTIRDLSTAELRQRCDPQEPFGRPVSASDAPAFQADLVSTRIEDDAAEVTVRITEFDGDPPFGGGGYDHTELFVLERDGEDWAVSHPAWPYWVCAGP